LILLLICLTMRSKLFPYTTLFRSDLAQEIAVRTIPGTDETVTREKLFSLGIGENVRTWREFAGILGMIEDTLGMVRNIMNLIGLDRKSTRLNSSHVKISYAVFCLK